MIQAAASIGELKIFLGIDDKLYLGNESVSDRGSPDFIHPPMLEKANFHALIRIEIQRPLEDCR